MDATKQIGKHLAFLGYEIENKILEGFQYTEAKNPTSYDVTYYEPMPGFIVFVSTFGIKQKDDDFLAFLNKANDDAIKFCTIYTHELQNKSLVIRFRAVYTGDYRKELFGLFFDELRREITLVLGNETFQNLIR